MKESLHEGCPLYDQSRYQQVEPNTGETVALQKRHQIPETNKYHHMHILEHWKIDNKLYQWFCHENYLEWKIL